MLFIPFLHDLASYTKENLCHFLHLLGYWSKKYLIFKEILGMRYVCVLCKSWYGVGYYAKSSLWLTSLIFDLKYVLFLYDSIANKVWQRRVSKKNLMSNYSRLCENSEDSQTLKNILSYLKLQRKDTFLKIKLENLKP